MSKACKYIFKNQGVNNRFDFIVRIQTGIWLTNCCRSHIEKIMGVTLHEIYI